MTECTSDTKVNGSSQATYSIPDYPHVIMMICPKCESEKIRTLSLTYPSTFECKSCGHVFLEARRSLIDE